MHVARHSWATTAKNANLPLWVISESLGHSSEKTTYTYLASFDQGILDRANEITTGMLTSSALFHQQTAQLAHPG